MKKGPKERIRIYGERMELADSHRKLEIIPTSGSAIDVRVVNEVD